MSNKTTEVKEFKANKYVFDYGPKYKDYTGDSWRLTNKLGVHIFIPKSVCKITNVGNGTLIFRVEAWWAYKHNLGAFLNAR